MPTPPEGHHTDQPSQEGRTESQRVANGEADHITYLRLAMQYGRLGDDQQVVALLQQAIRLKPEHPETHTCLATILLKQGQTDAAIRACRAALNLRADDPNTLDILGMALRRQGNNTDAIAAYRAVLKLRPNHPNTLNNLGVALQQSGDLEAALEALTAAVGINPHHPDALYNLANAWKQIGQPEAAIPYYESTLRLNRHNAEAHYSLATALLQCGSLERGWDAYAWRFKKQKPITPHANPGCPQWDGQPLGHRESLLVVSEQGYGEILLFLRYVIKLKKHGIAFNIATPTALHGLLRNSDIHEEPLNLDRANAVEHGQWIPMGCLPRYLSLKNQAPCAGGAYLSPSKAAINHWRDRLGSEQRPIIGINWRGNRTAEQDRGRSIPLELFCCLFGIDASFSLLSLQHGSGGDQILESSIKQRLVAEQASINTVINDPQRFEEYAAIAANCDLVITPATTLAHLCGAMGVNSWILANPSPSWAWGSQGTTTTWYPSIRIFRACLQGNWAGVINAIQRELQAWINHSE